MDSIKKKALPSFMRIPELPPNLPSRTNASVTLLVLKPPPHPMKNKPQSESNGKFIVEEHKTTGPAKEETAYEKVSARNEVDKSIAQLLAETRQFNAEMVQLNKRQSDLNSKLSYRATKNDKVDVDELKAHVQVLEALVDELKAKAKEVDELKARVKALEAAKARVEALEAVMDELEARVEALEAAGGTERSSLLGSNAIPLNKNGKYCKRCKNQYPKRCWRHPHE